MFRSIWRTLFPPRENQYAGLVAQSLAASQSVFHDWEFEPETKTIDPNTATLDQINAALNDCYQCRATEYPETDAGTYWAMDRSQELEAAIQSRFPDQAKAIIGEGHAKANRTSQRLYGPREP